MGRRRSLSGKNSSSSAGEASARTSTALCARSYGVLLSWNLRFTSTPPTGSLIDAVLNISRVAHHVLPEFSQMRTSAIIRRSSSSLDFTARAVARKCRDKQKSLALLDGGARHACSSREQRTTRPVLSSGHATPSLLDQEQGTRSSHEDMMAGLAMPRRMRRACTTQHMMPLFISLRTGDAEHHRTIVEALAQPPLIGPA